MEFNAVHQQGYDLNNDTGVNFFDPAGTTASTIAVDAAIISDTDKIAASTNEDTDGMVLQIILVLQVMVKMQPDLLMYIRIVWKNL